MKKEAEASLAKMIEKIHADNRNNERTLQIKTEYQNELGIPFLKEEVVGLTSGDLAKETDEDPNHIRKKYLDPLINLSKKHQVPRTDG
jgi:hypothetical protein